VVPDGKGWASVKPGASEPESRHRTQLAAVEAARRQVWEEGGGQLRIHDRSGLMMEWEALSPAPIRVRRGKQMSRRSRSA
jgi:hypothetical protein